MLADSDVVSKYLQPGWTPKKLLEIIAASDEFGVDRLWRPGLGLSKL